MDRRPTRWNPGSGANGGRPPAQAGGGSRSRLGSGGGSAGGGMRAEHLIVTFIIVGAVLAIGLSMPLAWLDIVLGWLGFR